MTRKTIIIIATLLIVPLFTACSLFGDDEAFSCKDLVVTGEDSPEAIEYRGDPSDQWVVTGIETEYDSSANHSITTLKVNAAYPNPTNPISKLTYDLPKHMSVRIKVRSSGGDYNSNIVDGRFTAGSYQVTADLSESSSKCFRADFYFEGSEKSNAYGLIKIERMNKFLYL